MPPDSARKRRILSESAVFERACSVTLRYLVGKVITSDVDSLALGPLPAFPPMHGEQLEDTGAHLIETRGARERVFNPGHSLRDNCLRIKGPTLHRPEHRLQWSQRLLQISQQRAPGAGATCPRPVIQERPRFTRWVSVICCNLL